MLERPAILRPLLIHGFQEREQEKLLKKLLARLLEDVSRVPHTIKLPTREQCTIGHPGYELHRHHLSRQRHRQVYCGGNGAFKV